MTGPMDRVCILGVLCLIVAALKLGEDCTSASTAAVALSIAIVEIRRFSLSFLVLALRLNGDKVTTFLEVLAVGSFTLIHVEVLEPERSCGASHWLRLSVSTGKALD